MLDVQSAQGAQQPRWGGDSASVQQVRRELALRPGLVDPRHTRDLLAALAQVAAGHALVIQGGDCAENPAECDAWSVTRKAGLLEMLGGVMKLATGLPVVRVGRIAGQFAKPRTRDTEWVAGRELPAFRGHMVNSPEPDPVSRVPDPRRLLDGYDASRAVLGHLGWGKDGVPGQAPVWTSHEALLLDYEVPLVRTGPKGPFLSSTHWPWIGERTRQLDGAHVSLFSQVIGPVACKVGPSATAGEVTALAEVLDPEHVPGRLTLVVRMGAENVGARLPPLVAAVRAAGHPVIWLTDPMHGNTVTGPDGLKTRYVASIVREVREFQRVVRAAGGIAGGLHLEATPDDVTECAMDASEASWGPDKYLSLCDPRLNPRQAAHVVAAWCG